MYIVTALYCSDAGEREWRTDDKKAADFLVEALRRNDDWVDVKVLKAPELASAED